MVELKSKSMSSDQWADWTVQLENRADHLKKWVTILQKKAHIDSARRNNLDHIYSAQDKLEQLWLSAARVDMLEMWKPYGGVLDGGPEDGSGSDVVMSIKDAIHKGWFDIDLQQPEAYWGKLFEGIEVPLQPLFKSEIDQHLGIQYAKAKITMLKADPDQIKDSDQTELYAEGSLRRHLQRRELLARKRVQVRIEPALSCAADSCFPCMTRWFAQEHEEALERKRSDVESGGHGGGDEGKRLAGSKSLLEEVQLNQEELATLDKLTLMHLRRLLNSSGDSTTAAAKHRTFDTYAGGKAFCDGKGLPILKTEDKLIELRRLLDSQFRMIKAKMKGQSGDESDATRAMSFDDVTAICNQMSKTDLDLVRLHSHACLLLRRPSIRS